MKLFRTRGGVVVEQDQRYFSISTAWDDIFRASDPPALISAAVKAAGQGAAALDPREILAPTSRQEVWASGVTYYRSRDARMEESVVAGGGDFYARVYEAERPELFFKASPFRVVGPGQPVRCRRDARWNVPEPELTLAVNAAGKIFGYTVGNDMSARDIEGENPLYLPQAKTYDGSCALGPCVLVPPSPLGKTTAIKLEIVRDGSTVFAGDTTLAQLKREPDLLVSFLTRETSFPDGVFLMTGTGIVPANDFTLRAGDEIRIDITDIGRLVNVVAPL
ncbi:MAG TPA: fumarylacetoacetate hydrolase family protein [Polyangia bacterium]|jgi:2-dehydro-3-deoxy-D-arabinonate dehydratase|nr:fumarylacetoacetate hydrolase family protein [Polyangia bacterium]